MMKRRTKEYLLLIVIAGFILRLLGLININLGGDFEYHWSVAGKIAQAEEFPLLGPGASINPNFHLGPFYYYLLAIPYFLGGGNYKFAIIFFSVLSSLSTYLLFKLSREWFNETESLKISALFAFSSLMITTGNFPWNAYLVPLIVIIMLTLLTEIKRGKNVLIIPLSLTYALALQLHLTVLLLIPFILLQIPFRKINYRLIIFSVFIIIAILSPWLVTEANLNFSQTQSLASTLLIKNNEECDFNQWLVNHGQGERCFHYIRNTLFIFRLLSECIFASTNIGLAVFTLVLTIFTFISTNHPQKKLFFSWLLSVFFLYIFYSANIYLHYMLIFVPLPYFILTLFLERIEKAKYGSVLSSAIIILIITNNLIHFLISLGTPRS